MSTNILLREQLIDEDRQRVQLEKVWAEPKGFIGWFMAVKHTTIGLRYVVTAFCFFLVAGLLAGAMRIQLAFPESHFLSNDKCSKHSGCCPIFTSDPGDRLLKSAGQHIAKAR